MTLDSIPFETTCHGDFAEFEASSGEWLRVRRLADGFLVTRFDKTKKLVGEPTEMTGKQLTKLL